MFKEQSRRWLRWGRTRWAGRMNGTKSTKQHPTARKRALMRITRILIALASLALILPGLALAREHRLAADWEDPQFTPRFFEKLLIICITDRTEARQRFEDKFVSHLRGRKIEGVTSYSIVPHLDRVEDRKAIVRALAEKGVSGAITVRVVPLKDRTEEDWSGDWYNWLRSNPRIHGLIEDTLPVSKQKSKRYGVEVALWESSDWSIVWAARTDTYKRKELEHEAGNLVQLTMAALREAQLL